MQHCSTDTAFNRKDASGGAEKLNYEWLRKKGNRNKANKQAEEGHGLCKKKCVKDCASPSSDHTEWRFKTAGMHDVMNAPKKGWLRRFRLHKRLRSKQS